uniref:Uncharacterized protein n=1 Tax=Mycena chlorophos TaxID=658473 RepID=A0ABQ0LKF2_MYCCL|nr:predicted protein [Mycena chlorophos]
MYIQCTSLGELCPHHHHNLWGGVTLLTAAAAGPDSESSEIGFAGGAFGAGALAEALKRHGRPALSARSAFGSITVVVFHAHRLPASPGLTAMLSAPATSTPTLPLHAHGPVADTNTPASSSSCSVGRSLGPADGDVAAVDADAEGFPIPDKETHEKI